MASLKAAKVALKVREDEILKLTEALGKSIREYFVLLGATGIVPPKPPRPQLEVAGRLTYGSMLIMQAIDLMRGLRK
jgi:hypothetical protein